LISKTRAKEIQAVSLEETMTATIEDIIMTTGSKIALVGPVKFLLHAEAAIRVLRADFKRRRYFLRRMRGETLND